MSSVRLSGNAGGTGIFTVASPNSNNNQTLTLPDSTGTVALTSDITGGIRGQVFTSNGTFTIPTGITALKVTVVGGGGGGAGGAAIPCGTLDGSGGSSAATAYVFLTALTPGNTIGVTVGAAGSAGGSSSNGGAGGNSSIQSGTQTITTVTAGGGGGGRHNNTPNAPGTATNATYALNGTYGINLSFGADSSIGWGGRSSSPVTGAVGHGAGGRGVTSGAGAGTAGVAGIVIFEW
jgi:hypothetical protein